MSIQGLSADVVARIAAGEVVERPVSVAKELIENSLDAGAAKIVVEVRAGGVGLIRVVDDGVGIPADQIKAAFERHATSKISDYQDLERVTTLGFRGEALASIAAVADVAMVARTAEATGGEWVRVVNGRVEEEGPRGAPPGTSVTVRNLFRDVPARLKFLKSNAAEASRITSVVSHYALAFPSVGFALSIDGRRVFATQGSGDLRDALAQLYGLETAQAMLEVDHREGIGDIAVEVTGMTSPPGLTRANRSYITLFVNRRLVHSRPLTFAVIDAYEGLLMVGRYPIAVLDLSIDPSQTDVNVHPAKAEVRFRDEGLAFSALRHSVRGRLHDASVARPVADSFDAGIPSEAAAPGPTGASASPSSPLAVDGATELPPEDPVQQTLKVPVLRVLGQLRSTFIVAEGPNGMYLLDQHTAHERVLFDQLREDRARGEPKVQGLLEPVPVSLSPGQEQSLEERMDVIGAYGFHLEPFGERTVLIRGVPAALASKAPERSLLDVLDEMDSDDLKAYGWEDRLLATIACHGAVRAGQDLTPQEMQEMVRLLEATENPHSCPHGRPVMMHMSNAQLEKGFSRR
ncbi:MAG: DNA mismatch repair endonuclease MutL [Chloroflexi bacterium]|nr:DNA mismatch repair endonuclease MutL [Chloroflexota bacterium]